MLASLAVAPATEALLESAQALAFRLKLPLVSVEEVRYDFLLVCGSERLELHKPAEKTQPLFVDFSNFRFRQTKEPLVKAVGLKGDYKPQVLDCTAGLAQDAFVLALQGCKVTMLERSGLIHALLEDGLARASKDPKLAAIASRMILIQQDALEYLHDMRDKPDVIYLDPMYPESAKSAAKRKSMRFFRELIGNDLDAEAVLAKALTLGVKRVVVKRSLKALVLMKEKARGSLKAKTTRFDIY